MNRPDVEKLLAECKAAAPGPGVGARRTITSLCEYIQHVETRAREYRLALEGLTPGGSEFYNDLERCVAHVRDRFDSGDQAKIDRARLRQSLARMGM